MRSALAIAKDAAELASDYYSQLDELTIETKGQQDFVSEADRRVELFIRDRLGSEYADDGIIGEEFDNIESRSGYTWVIDPIDGTASFVVNRPGWCVVIACIKDGHTQLAVVIDPLAKETFRAVRGQGAFLNDKPIRVSESQSLGDGTLGVGYCNRFPAQLLLNFLQVLMTEHGGVFYQNASGALMLCYVACGRLIGYSEAHMNPWDCLAALLVIEEAGGKVQPRDDAKMLARGGRVVTACPGVFEVVAELSDSAYGDYGL